MEHNNFKLNDEEYVSAMVSERSPALEYVGGYCGRTKQITVKNLICGHVYKASYHGVVHKGGYTYCPICQKESARIRKIEKERQAWDRQAKKIRKRAKRMQQLTFLSCEHCGALFIPKTKISSCCTPKCARAETRKRNGNRNGDSRLHGYNVRDWNISLKDLSIRDNDICWLCGKPVDWHDYTMQGDTFIAGNFYPSIDHVMPLARGGLHEWDNVRLAHRICNTIKRDNIVK